MKSKNIFLFLLVGTIWIVILFFSFITGIKKTMKAPPKRSGKTTGQMLSEQRHTQEETLRQQQQIMREQRQKVRDLQSQMRDVRSKY